MPRKRCRRHGADRPCTCALGNLYRFVEPVLLLLLKEKGCSYGYDLWSEAGKHALTDAALERAVVYRTLHMMEGNGHVISSWDTEGTGPARRVYRLTADGEEHLAEWATVLKHVSRSMDRFVRRVAHLGGEAKGGPASGPAKDHGVTRQKSATKEAAG